METKSIDYFCSLAEERVPIAVRYIEKGKEMAVAGHGFVGLQKSDLVELLRKMCPKISEEEIEDGLKTYIKIGHIVGDKRPIGKNKISIYYKIADSEKIRYDQSLIYLGWLKQELIRFEQIPRTKI